MGTRGGGLSLTPASGLMAPQCHLAVAVGLTRPTALCVGGLDGPGLGLALLMIGGTSCASSQHCHSAGYGSP